jgi:hypothetical protein
MSGPDPLDEAFARHYREQVPAAWPGAPDVPGANLPKPKP